MGDVKRARVPSDVNQTSGVAKPVAEALDNSSLIFKCNVCYDRFSDEETFKTHTQIHSKERPFACTICHHRSKRREQFSVHRLTHLRAGQLSFPCKCCRDVFLSKTEFDEHVEACDKDHIFKCDICGFGATVKGPFVCHLTTHAKTNITCKVCNKGFRRNADMRRHMFMHNSNSNRFQCKVCKHSYNVFEKLIKHIKQKHDYTEFSRHCKECNKTFSLHSSYEGHKCLYEKRMRLLSFKCRPDFTCKECDFKCNRMDALLNHLVEHRLPSNGDSVAAVKPDRSYASNIKVVCDFCKKGFRRYCNMATHQKRMHGVQEGEMKWTANQNYIPEPKDTVDDIECQICHKISKGLLQFKKHMSTMHGSSDVYTCEVCGKVYDRMVALTAHMRKSHPKKTNRRTPIAQTEVATKDPAYKRMCKVCKTIFSTRKILSEHMWTDHNLKGVTRQLLKPVNKTPFRDTPEKSGLTARMRKSHPKKTNRRTPIAQTEVATKDPAYKRMCKVCKTIFSTRKILSEHMWTDHNLKGVTHQLLKPVTKTPFRDTPEKSGSRLGKGSEPNKNTQRDSTVSNSSSPQHTDTGLKKTDTIFQCSICNRISKSKLMLDVHKDTHTKRKSLDDKISDEELFTCDFCNNTFITELELVDHIKEHDIEQFESQSKSSLIKQFNTNKRSGVAPQNGQIDVYMDTDDPQVTSVNDADRDDIGNAGDVLLASTSSADLYGIEMACTMDEVSSTTETLPETKHVMTEICPLCQQLFLRNQANIQCLVCSRKFCLDCGGVPKEAYSAFSEADDFSWMCVVCRPLVPVLTILCTQMEEFRNVVEEKMSDFESRLQRIKQQAHKLKKRTEQN